jgi:para-nitrobenzyl esterase
LTILHSGRYRQVPIILGANRSESGSVNTLMPSVTPGMPDYQALNDVIKGNRTLDDVLLTNRDKELWLKTRDYGSRFWCATMVDEVARELTRHQEDVFVYSFDWGDSDVVSQPMQFIYGAAHALEIPFFHAATDRWREWTADSLVFSMLTAENRKGRLALSDAMVSFLSQFARTGNPNSSNSSVPVWQPWSRFPGGPKRIVFDGDLTRAKLRMSNEELSVAGVRFELDREPPDIRDHVVFVLTALHDHIEYERGDYQYGPGE